MPGAAPANTIASLNVFAKDARVSEAGRLACLYEGLKQPSIGVATVQIQPCVTEHVVLRGRYQTLPISLTGFSVASAAAEHVAQPETPHITLDQAVPRFAELIEALPDGTEEKTSDGGSGSSANKIKFTDETKAALDSLIKYWKVVNTSLPKIETTPPPVEAFKAATQAADLICCQLADGANFPAEKSASNADVAYEQEVIDMVMGWTGFLADISGLTAPPDTARRLYECATAGLAAAVLLFTRPSAASLFLSRHGQLLLSDALKLPQAPISQLRHASAACLLIVQSAGALACEALLGWWSPKFVQWIAKKESPPQPQAKHQNAEPAQGRGGQKRKKEEELERSQRQERKSTRPEERKEERQDQRQQQQHQIRERQPRRDQEREPRSAERPEKKDTDQPYRAEAKDAREIIMQRRKQRETGGIDGRDTRKEEPQDRGSGRRRDRRDEEKKDGRQAEHRGGGRGSRRQGRRGERTIPQVDGPNDEEEEGGTRGENKRRRKDGENGDAGGGRRRQQNQRQQERDQRGRGGNNRRDGGYNGEKYQNQQQRGREYGRGNRAEADMEDRWGGGASAGGIDMDVSMEHEERHDERGARGYGRDRRDAEPERGNRRDRDGGGKDTRKKVEDNDGRRGRGSPDADLGARNGQRGRDARRASSRSRSPPPGQRGDRKRADEREAVQERGGRGGRQQQNRQRQTSPGAASGREAREEEKKQQGVGKLPAVNRYWEDRLRNYSGIYSFVAAIAVELRPQQLASIVARLVNILTFYERAATFSTTAAHLTQQFLPENRAGMPSKEAAAAAATCGAALAGLAESLKRGFANSRVDLNTDDFSTTAALSWVSRLDSLQLELLQARRVLALLPALLIVPSTHKARGTEDGDAAQATAAAAAMANQLSLGLKPFLVELTSSAQGLKLLAGVASELLRLLRLPGALEPALAAALTPIGNLAAALAAVDDLFSSTLESNTFATAAQTLKQLLHGSPAERLPALQAVCLTLDKTLPKCSEVLAGQCTVLQHAAGLDMSTSVGSASGDTFGGLLDAFPSLEIASTILLALVNECNATIVSLVAPRVESLMPPIASAIQALYACPAPGAASVFSDLERIYGGMEALAALQTNAVKGLLSFLANGLPPLAAVGNTARQGSDDSSQNAIDWEDVREFWDDSRRRARVQTSLKLLSLNIWAPKKVGRDTAAEIQYNDGQRLVLRSIITAHQVMAGSQADRQWVSRTGAAIDPSMAASNRAAALDFLSSAASVASAFFQHMRNLVKINGTACVAAFVEAHGTLCSDEACLLSLIGQSGTSSTAATALTARHHLTSVLRCWLEASDWTPDILPFILFGSMYGELNLKHAVPALPPRQLFAATCLIGDLAPEEWPPAGRRTHNPAPLSRSYRLAFARAIELNMAPFESLITACVEAEPVLLRAAAIRMLARASGCGGGMGPFVIGPLVNALENGVTSQTPAHDVRKVLELMVPLVYRPALKAAFLDSSAPISLAQVLRVMSSGIPIGSPPGTPPLSIDPADASAICTMAVECLVVLCNPDQKLDPMTPLEVSLIEDVPNTARGTVIASTIIEVMASLGVNVPLAERVLRLMAGTPPGRAALRRGASALHAAAIGEPNPMDPSVKQIAAAAQWVATRYWSLSQHAQQSAASTAEAYADVADIMKEICVTLENDGIAPLLDTPAAAMRFAAASKAALSAAVAQGVDVASSEQRWDRGADLYSLVASGGGSTSIAAQQDTTASGIAADQHLCGGIYDSVTRVFWKNHRARAVQQTPTATAMILRKYSRRACLPDENLTVADTLHLPLTRPVRPLNEDMEVGLGAAAHGVVHESAGQRVGSSTSGAAEGVASPPAGGGRRMMMTQLRRVEVPEVPKEVVQPPAGGDASEVKQEVEEYVPLPAAVPAVPTVAVAGLPVPVIAAAEPAADFDLYADLNAGADVDMMSEPIAAAPVEEGPVPSPEEERRREIEAEEFGGTLTGTGEVIEEGENEDEIVDIVGGQKQQQKVPKRFAAVQRAEAPAAATKPGEIPMDDPAALLANPASIAALLQDPVKMQQLLVKNPALLAVIKSKLGGGK